MLDDVKSAVIGALHELGCSERVFETNLPDDRANGDIVTNVALVCAKDVGRAPRDFAALLVERLCHDPRFSLVWVAGPGFVNMRLSDDYLHQVARSIIRLGKGYGAGTMAGTFAACFVDNDESRRQRWAAEVASCIASHLGLDAKVVSTQPELKAAREKLEAHFQSSERFGETTVSELLGLTEQLSVITHGLAVAERVQFFAQQGGGFRPGLLEHVSASEHLRCTALARCQIQPTSSDSVARLMKLYCLSHRADKALDLSCKTVQSACAANPAFLIHYAAMACRSAMSSEGVDQKISEEEARLVCKLAAFPATLRLAYERAEPHRVGLFMLACAELLAWCQQPRIGRDRKNIRSDVLAAADVVFSVGFAMIGVKPLDDFS